MTATIVYGLAGLALAIFYATSCLFWPYTSCLRCRGTAKRGALWGGGFRPCGWCSATGRRLKFGRWLFNLISKKRKAAR